MRGQNGRKKCTGPLERCDSLDGRLNVEANHGRGFRIYLLTYLPDKMTDVSPDGKKFGDQWVAGIVYAATNKRDDMGVLLNYCPWCGADIMWWAREHVITNTLGKKKEAKC